MQKPIIFDIRSRPRNVAVTTGSKGNDKFVDSAQYKWNYLSRCEDEKMSEDVKMSRCEDEQMRR